MINVVEPDRGLESELRDVGAAAQAFLAALEAEPPLKGSNFPIVPTRILVQHLRRLGDGTAEGCGAPLDTGRLRLNKLRYAHFGRADQANLDINADPPAYSRHSPLGNALVELINTIETAMSAYARQMQAPILSEDEAPMVANDNLSLAFESERADAEDLALTTGRLTNDIDARINTQSVQARLLVRVGRTMANVAGVAAAEAAMREKQPKLLGRVGLALDRIAITSATAANGAAPGQDFQAEHANWWGSVGLAKFRAQAANARVTAANLVKLSHELLTGSDTLAADLADDSAPAFNLREHPMSANTDWRPYLHLGLSILIALVAGILFGAI